MDQPLAVAITAFADVWPRATRNGDRRCPIRQWRGRSFDFDTINFTITSYFPRLKITLYTICTLIFGIFTLLSAMFSALRSLSHGIWADGRKNLVRKTEAC